ncbi:bacillithiol system redox-active protein YtxJ [Caldalkalibacillus mannanilyticus]|uniref:bacillithiol system redox-active protein YtxJ n=1 Tax=Caldalkalibacillus mannanilyticus TaxID=1418 RepID=UPI00046A501C|nr:bacillithiol system redox-active protein YtxJ [Caldalkalibacillus mannanilyticus]
MSAMKEITQVEEWNQLWGSEDSYAIIKHSTICPVSADGLEQFEKTLEELKQKGFTPYLVKVRESRPVSNQIEQDTQIKHESPQVLIVQNKKVTWNESHWRITQDAILEAVK